MDDKRGKWGWRKHGGEKELMRRDFIPSRLGAEKPKIVERFLKTHSPKSKEPHILSGVKFSP